MSEINIQHYEDISQSNRELLIDEGGVLGPVLASAYDLAIREDPDVGQAKIIELPLHAVSTGISRYADMTESGRPEVAIMLGDMQYALDRKQRERQAIPIFDLLLARRLHLDPADITPQLVYVDAFLHELGHVRKNAKVDDLAALRVHNKQQAESMPLGNRWVSRLLHPGTEEQKYLAANTDELLERFGCSTVDDLINLQYAAYRNLDNEKDADTFAATILTQNPELLASLLSRGLVQQALDADTVSFDQQF